MRNPRPNTPDEKLPEGGTRIVAKRCCNGCGERLGDVTDAEMERAIAGLPLEDVRHECERCAIEYADELAAMAARPSLTEGGADRV